MHFILKIIVMAIVYAALLYILSKAFRDFKIENNGLLAVTVILVVVDLILYKVLMWMSILPKAMTLYLLAPIINWAINVLIIWLTDKLTKSLEIGQTSTLIISGLFLAAARWVVGFLI